MIDHKEEKKETERTFIEIREEAREIWEKLVKTDKSNVEKLNKIIVDTFGKQIKLSEITENQKDLFEIVLAEMKEI